MMDDKEEETKNEVKTNEHDKRKKQCCDLVSGAWFYFRFDLINWTKIMYKWDENEETIR